MAFGLVAGIVGASTNLIGNVIKNREQNKAIDKNNANVMSLYNINREMNKIQKETMLQSQQQVKGRNLAVQSASGFALSDFNPLNQYLETRFDQENQLFNLQGQFRDREILAGIQQKPSKFLQAFNIGNQALQGGAGIYNLFNT